MKSKGNYNSEEFICFTTFYKDRTDQCLKKTKMSAPGKDQIFYIVKNKVNRQRILLYNNVWEGAIVVPICRHGEDCTNPGN